MGTIPVTVQYEPRAADGTHRWPLCSKHHSRPCLRGCPIVRPFDKLLGDGERQYLEGIGLHVEAERILRVERDGNGNIKRDKDGRHIPVLNDRDEMIWDTIETPHPCPSCGDRTIGTETRLLGTVEECGRCAKRFGMVG